MMDCDPLTGACRLPEPGVQTGNAANPANRGWTVHYVGDPMCSWCWGISPTVQQLADHCERQGMGFTLTVGGLRAGGGDPWVAPFKAFLRREWTHIAQVTGQPFGFSLLEAPHFDYDTEPACRAVVVAQQMLEQHGRPTPAILPFFSAVQRRFYVEGLDPKEVDFYRPICLAVGLPFDDFHARFDTPAARQATRQAFLQARHWGVNAFPTLLVEGNGRVVPLASGYVTTEAALSAIARAVEAFRPA